MKHIITTFKMKDKQKQNEFMVLYSPVHDSFVRYCKAKSYGLIDYEDLISESVLRAFSDFEKLRNKEAFLGFLFGIASNILKNLLRKKDFIKYVEEYNYQLIDEKYNPETKYNIELLYKALNQLQEKYKEALILFEINGFNIKEIADIQNTSISSVKQRLKRGREKLAEILGVAELKKEKTIEHSKILITMFL